MRPRARARAPRGCSNFHNARAQLGGAFGGWELRYRGAAARDLAFVLWPYAGFKKELLFAIAFGDMPFNPDYEDNPPEYSGYYTEELVTKCQASLLSRSQNVSPSSLNRDARPGHEVRMVERVAAAWLVDVHSRASSPGSAALCSQLATAELAAFKGGAAMASHS